MQEGDNVSQATGMNALLTQLSTDGDEGRRAFLEKRPPEFTGGIRQKGEAYAVSASSVASSWTRSMRSISRSASMACVSSSTSKMRCTSCYRRRVVWLLRLPCLSQDAEDRSSLGNGLRVRGQGTVMQGRCCNGLQALVRNINVAEPGGQTELLA